MSQNPTVTRSPRAQQKLPPINSQPPLPQASGVYNTLNSGDYPHNYTGLSGNLQYDELYGVQTGSEQYERVPGYGYAIPGQQVSVTIIRDVHTIFEICVPAIMHGGGRDSGEIFISLDYKNLRFTKGFKTF